MLEVAWGQNQRLDPVATEDDRQRLGLLWIRDIVNHPRTAQGSFVEKTPGTHSLNKDALGDLSVEQMELVGADVLSAKQVWGAVEVLGKLGHVAQISIDRVQL